MIYGINKRVGQLMTFFSCEELEEFLYGMTDWYEWDNWIFFNADSARKISWRDERCLSPQSLLDEIRYMMQESKPTQ